MKTKKVEISLYKMHEGQLHIKQNARRFNCIPCARRFGKTQFICTTRDNLILPAVLHGKCIAIFTPVMKDFERSFTQIKEIYKDLILKQDSQARIIYFVGGGELRVYSLSDKGDQDSGRGNPFDRVIYEETQKIPDDVFRHNWTQAIRPALSDRKGDAYFIGTAFGRDNFWHQLCSRGAKNGDCVVNSDGEADLDISHYQSTNAEDFDFGDDRDWITFRMVSTVNPIMTESEVMSARKDLDELSWKQEYFSHFCNFSGNIWAYVLKDRTLQKKLFRPLEKVNFNDRIYLSFDFNKVPMTALVMQKKYHSEKVAYDTKFKYSPLMKKVFKVGKKGASATIFDTCEAIRVWIYQNTGKKIGTWRDEKGNIIGKYPCTFNVKVTGDASGNATSGMVKDPTDYYRIIKEELQLAEMMLDGVPKANPYHADSHLQVNTILSRCPEVGIDETECQELQKDLLRIKDDGKHGIPKAAGEEKQADLLDCLRYMFHAFCRDIWV